MVLDVSIGHGHCFRIQKKTSGGRGGREVGRAQEGLGVEVKPGGGWEMGLGA